MNAGPRSLLPPAGTVDVWQIPLDLPAADRERLCACLDEPERRHAERVGADGGRWAVARAARREILSRCCGVAPGALEFELESHGKPWLVDAPGVHFNMSSREGIALLAISATGPVGVDIEGDDPPGDIIEVARQFLSPEEFDAITRAPAAQRARRFAVAWTRFESVQKLWGLGLEDPHSDRSTTVRDLVVPAGFVAAVAAEGEGWSVSLRDAAEALGIRPR